MDFGFVSLDSFVAGPPESVGAPVNSDSPETKPRPGIGSESLKPERSMAEEDDDDNAEEENGWRASKVAKMSVKETMPLMRSESIFHQQEEQMLSFSSSSSSSSQSQNQSYGFPYYQRMPIPRYSGYGTSLHGGIRGPFTASQWVELEHQALIYKYITSNVSVPSNLLLPLKKSLSPFGFATSSAFTSFPPSSFGWGSFHLGFADNSDPEPGRCRRTDGKKWRCSRDAVVDQKYCERHINRGRHRSRKPVEAAAKAMPMPMPMMSSSPSSSSATAAIANVDSAMHNRRGLAISSATILQKPNNEVGSAFVVPKQETKSLSSSQSSFGLVSTNSLLNPSHNSSYNNNNPLRHFIDDWPNNNNKDEPKPEWTRLSMSTTPRPTMPTISLALGQTQNQAQQANWVSSSWAGPSPTMGGPLGEVLTNGWDASPRLGSSPTGVLQRSTFCSLSNSSSGNSPRADITKKVDIGTSVYDEVLGGSAVSDL